MNKLLENQPQYLNWELCNLAHGVYEFSAGPDLYATLQYDHAKDASARAATACGTWFMICARLGPPHITIRTANFSYVAAFQGGRNGSGQVEFRAGRRIRWGCTDIWETEWAFVTADDMPLLWYKAALPNDKSHGQVEVFPAAYETPDLPVLLLLGCLLLVLMEEEANRLYLAPAQVGKCRSFVA